MAVRRLQYSTDEDDVAVQIAVQESALISLWKKRIAIVCFES